MEGSTVIKAIIQFQCNVTEDQFKKIFGDQIGSHLWYKYRSKYNFEFISFWCSLDEGNQSKLQKAINIR